MKALVPALFLFAVGAVAPANLLVDPTGGTQLSSSDDSGSFETLSGFSFYGAPVTSIYASTNGNLNTLFSNNQQPPITTPQISPLADDFVQIAGTSSFSRLTTASAYSYTWKDDATFGANDSLWTFQATLVRANATIGGIALLQNDIVFSYGRIGSAFRDDQALIGLSNGNIATANLAPGSDPTTGYINRATAGSFFPTGENYVRYRFNGTTYDRTIVGTSAVPEPATLAILGAGAVALVRRRRRG